MATAIKTNNLDSNRVNVFDTDDLENWAKKFGVSNERLKSAIKAVGDRPKALEAYLKK